MIITLYVEDGRRAEEVARGHLEPWFAHGARTAPYSPGTLLHWDIQHAPLGDSHRAARAWLIKASETHPRASTGYDQTPYPAPPGYLPIADYRAQTEGKKQ